MNNLDLARTTKKTFSIVPAAITATTTGSEIDVTTGVGKAVNVCVGAGVITAADATNFMTFTVTQATESGGTFVAADSSQYDPVNSWDRKIDATTEGSAIYSFNFLLAPGYGYLKVVATETGAFNGIFGAWLEHPTSKQPANT